MNFFTRLGNGWSMGMASLKVIRKSPELLMFPLISGVALLFVIASFLGLIYFNWGFEADTVVEEAGTLEYIIVFLFYLVGYFVIVFFNVGLVHCSRTYFQGGKPSVSEGINFAMERIHYILGWSALSATIGLLLKAVEDKGGVVGSIVSSVVGVVWSIVAFFVVPVLAYEEVGPLEALKRSGSIMKEKWGESIGASFSFGIITFVGILLIALPIGFVMGMIHPFLGIGTGLLVLFLIQGIMSAAEMVFIASIYHRIVEKQPVEDFESLDVDGLFVRKEKKGLF